MKLASFVIKSTGAATVGAVVKGGILDLHAASKGRLPTSMIKPADGKQHEHVVFAALDLHALQIIISQGHPYQPAGQQ